MSPAPSSSRTSSSRGGGSQPRRGKPSTQSRRPSRAATPPPAPVKSDLEVALDAAAELAAADPQTDATFASIGLPQKLVTALERRGMTAPFAIQTRTIPDALTGRDVLGRAQTGSGKTLAFGLPLLARLAGGQRRGGRPRGLVLVPTRELAQQVHDALQPLAQGLDVKLCAVYGGASMGRQIDQLRRAVDIVVATPGRLQDLIEQGECSLAEVQVAVLDEADHMADLGFLPVVTALLAMTPPDGQRLLFSATLDRGVDKLVRQFLTDPAMHAVASDTSHVELMDHRVFAVSHDSKIEIAAEIAARPARTLIFVRTKHGADRLAMQLRRTGVEAAAIHGNLTQNARKKALDAFSRGSSRVLVATDVAARGIHVDDVDLVMHFDPPADHKDYLHRSGRTARAGASGTVLSLLLSDQVREHQRMRERAGIDANAQTVTPGHPAVREIAESGEQIVVQAPAHFAAPVSSGSRRPSSGRPYRPASSSGGSGGRGAGARKGAPAGRHTQAPRRSA
ncbi:MAG: box helicase domain protein [Frankiales bacterium]|nr:box helicase domain protein [Frankiales bacterium]